MLPRREHGTLAPTTLGFWRAPERPQSGQLVRGGAEHPRPTTRRNLKSAQETQSGTPFTSSVHVPGLFLSASIAARPSAHTSPTVGRIARPQARTPTTPHRIQARTQRHAPKEKDPQTPRRLAQKRIRAHPRLIEVSCGIFSSAGASDATPSGPSSFPASIAARPSSTHLPIRRPHRPTASAYPQPHHIPSKRVPNSTHPKARPHQPPDASPKSESAHHGGRAR